MRSRNVDLQVERRSGFTLIELIVVILILFIGFALLMPVTRTSRGAARRSQCKNNLKHIGLGIHYYHENYNYFPSAMMGTEGKDENTGNQRRLSGVVGILPFNDNLSLYNQVTNTSEFNGRSYPSMGPAPWMSEYEPWQTRLPEFMCPSAMYDSESPLGTTNYAFNIGDQSRNIHYPKVARGAFACGKFISQSDFTDGLSNTILMAEIDNPLERRRTGNIALVRSSTLLDTPISCFETASADDEYPAEQQISQHGRGTRWADGAAPFSLVNTILPPNDASCANRSVAMSDGFYTASSAHHGGCHVLFGDGRVLFVTENIDVGMAHHSDPIPKSLDGKSPFGIWGALGTRVGGEQISEF